MKRLSNAVALALLGMALALVSTTTALAQAWPTKPIRIIVPYAPGGASDSLTRTVARKMSELLGQPIIVENKPGGASTIGIAEAARAPADGYTIMHVAVPFVITQFVYPNLPYDGAKDFVPLGLLQTAPLVLVVNPALNIRTPADYIQAAKKRPGEIMYATSGSGSVTHLTGELLKIQAGIDIVPVPYRGGGQSVMDVIGGQVTSAFLSPIEVSQHIKSGKLVGVAVSTIKRSPSLPDLPTFAEAGVDGFDVMGWFGLIVRTGTPPEVIAKLSDALRRSLQSPEVHERIAQTGNVPQGSIEEFADLLAREYPRWSRVVKAANIKPD